MSKLGSIGVGALVVGSALGGVTGSCSVFGERKVQNSYGTVVIDVDCADDGRECVDESCDDEAVRKGLAYVCRPEDYREADLQRIVGASVFGAGDERAGSEAVLGRWWKCKAEMYGNSDEYMECNHRLMEIHSEIIGIFGDMFASCAREVVGWEKTRKGCDVGCVDEAVANKLGRGDLGREYSMVRDECKGFLKRCIESEDKDSYCKE